MTRHLRRGTAAEAPIGYFVHHQGRGHAERCAALVAALPAARPVTVFSARDDIFPPMRRGVEIRRLPSLFEPTGGECPADWVGTPDTLHCAPLGWPGIRRAMAEIAGWFDAADPALLISDVSAEIAQMARICSVPHVAVLQHGDRDDPGHRAAFDGAAGLLAPFDARLAQPEWSPQMRARTCFAGGLGIDMDLPGRAEARARIGVGQGSRMVLVLSGGGGSGFAAAPLGVGARTDPDAVWITIGHVARDWHATEPANLRHDGWVESAADHLAAADLVVASTGNTICHQVLAAGLPWIAVPEWRYFDEQVRKAQALAAAGLAHHLPALPASAQAWSRAIAAAGALHDPARQRAMVRRDAAAHAADWIERLVSRLRAAAPSPVPIPIAKDAP